MSVKLISWSQPSVALEQEGIDSAQELIAYCATCYKHSLELSVG